MGWFSPKKRQTKIKKEDGEDVELLANCKYCGTKYATPKEAMNCCLKERMADGRFGCSSCGERYDTQQEANECCEGEDPESSESIERSTSEDGEPYSTKDFIVYSKSNEYAILFEDDIGNNANNIYDKTDLENSSTTWYFECLEELAKKGFVYERNISIGETSYPLYVKQDSTNRGL